MARMKRNLQKEIDVILVELLWEMPNAISDVEMYTLAQWRTVV